MSAPQSDRVSMLNVQQIRTFCAVFECGGYADAARLLNQTTTTLWEQIKVLQRTYRIELFQRVGRRIIPTASGEILYRQFRPLLAGIESSFELVAEQSEAIQTEIRLVTGMRMILEELGAPLRQFTRLYPTSTLKLMTANNSEAQELVKKQTVDIAMLIEPSKQTLLDGLTSERMYAIEYLAVIPSRHRLAKQSKLKVTDLLAEPLVVGSPNTIGRQLLDHAIFRLGLNTKVKVAVETDNSAITIACVRAGIGIGIIAGKRDGNLMKQVTTRPLLDELGKVHVAAITRAGWQPTQAIRTLLHLIRDSGSK